MLGRGFRRLLIEMPTAGSTLLGFVTWDRKDPTGGNVYNRALIAELRTLGIDVRLQELAGPWPDGDASTHLALARALRSAPACLVDGIVACGSPDVVAAAVESGHSVTIVVHLPLSDEFGIGPARRQRYALLESRVVHIASGVLCSSRWAAAELSSRYGRGDVGVAVPGVTPAPAARGSQDSGPPLLVSLASLTPTKDQLTLIRALAQLTELPWTADLIGSDRADPGYAAQVRTEIAAAGLAERIMVPGVLVGQALDQKWAVADLLVLTSRVETYGLVVTEALARGIPAVVSVGTGAVEALQEGATPDSAETPGTTVPPADPAGLAAVLRSWLAEPVLRRSWRQAALARRVTLPGWQQTAAAVVAYLNRLPESPLARAGLPPASPPTPPLAPPR
jgi:glycosyltransferase involved in cell wall biosynthesis